MKQHALDQEAQAALTSALDALLRPLAMLAVAHGMPFAVADELFRRAYVDAARRMLGEAAGSRDISRVSTATGMNRREVTRLTEHRPAAATMRRSPATEVFTRWRGDRALHDKAGRPRTLPRQGPAPSFESLAQSVTRDVHPRSLLDELIRLGLAELTANGKSVRLVRHAFVPLGDRARSLGFVGSNAGDHLAAAVENVLGEAPAHFEQALFASELSEESLEAIKRLVSAQWTTLMHAMVPAINKLISADEKAARKSGRVTNRRVRVGLYSYSESEAAPRGGEPEET